MNRWRGVTAGADFLRFVGWVRNNRPQCIHVGVLGNGVVPTQAEKQQCPAFANPSSKITSSFGHCPEHGEHQRGMSWRAWASSCIDLLTEHTRGSRAAITPPGTNAVILCPRPRANHGSPKTSQESLRSRAKATTPGSFDTGAMDGSTNPVEVSLDSPPLAETLIGSRPAPASAGVQARNHQISLTSSPIA